MSRNNRNFWEKANTEFVMVTGEIAEVSSTKVRELIKDGKDASQFIPKDAIEYFNQIAKIKRD
jgi:phosphopantetheine adenylyltransferase